MKVDLYADRQATAIAQMAERTSVPVPTLAAKLVNGVMPEDGSAAAAAGVQVAATTLPAGVNAELWTRIRQLVSCGYLPPEHLSNVLSMLEPRPSASLPSSAPPHQSFPAPVAINPSFRPRPVEIPIAAAAHFPASAAASRKSATAPANGCIDPSALLASLQCQAQIEIQSVAAALQKLQHLQHQQNGFCGASSMPANGGGAAPNAGGGMPANLASLLANAGGMSANVANLGGMPAGVGALLANIGGIPVNLCGGTANACGMPAGIGAVSANTISAAHSNMLPSTNAGHHTLTAELPLLPPSSKTQS